MMCWNIVQRRRKTPYGTIGATKPSIQQDSVFLTARTQFFPFFIYNEVGAVLNKLLHAILT